MRDILFRGKRKSNGKWIEGYYAVFDPVDIPDKNRKPTSVIFPVNANCNCWIKYFYNAIEVLPDTVGQFTGLTDKDGKMIFEGDVVKYPWVDVYGVSDTLMVVHYVDGEFLIKPVSNDCGTDCWEIRISGENARTEIIGNIYDNPELLEEE